MLWIDRLCIDQSNIDGRGSQVQIMRDIYKRATKLFVWIGTETDESTIALRTLDTAGKVLPNLYETG
jgi:Heterokaryon incompatibility protein (HET)